ncbi:regulatory protein [Desmospora sp. 8437]|nr:regulatory protein [Desmospora sp. 8437]
MNRHPFIPIHQWLGIQTETVRIGSEKSTDIKRTRQGIKLVIFQCAQILDVNLGALLHLFQ